MKQEFLLDVTLLKGSDLTRIASLWDICHYYVTRFMGFKCLTLKKSHLITTTCWPDLHELSQTIKWDCQTSGKQPSPHIRSDAASWMRAEPSPRNSNSPAAMIHLPEASTNMLLLLFSAAWQQRRNSPFDAPWWMCTATSARWSGESAIMAAPGCQCCCSIVKNIVTAASCGSAMTCQHWLTAGSQPYRECWSNVRWRWKGTEPLELISGLLSLCLDRKLPLVVMVEHTVRDQTVCRCFFSFSHILMCNIDTFEEDCAMYRLEPV